MPADAYRPQPLIFKEKADAYIDQLIMTSNADDYFVIKVHLYSACSACLR